MTLNNDGDNVVVDNASYSPNSFEVIKNLMHLFPMWSSAFQNRLERLVSDAPQRTEDDERPDCLSNEPVENHFKGVKHGRVHDATRICPYQFVAAELRYVLGKLNEAKLPKLKSKSRRKDISERGEVER